MDLTSDIPILRELPLDVQAVILRILLLLIVLVVVWVLRRVITAVLLTPVKRLVKRTSASTDDLIMRSIKGPLNVALIAIAIALTVAMLNFGPDVTALAGNLTRSLLIAAAVFAVYNIVGIITLTPEALQRVTGLSIEKRLLPFLTTILKIFIVVMGVLIIIQEWGYDATGLIASLGVVGLAFSLAAQDTAANLFGFTAIVSDNPFDVGDFIIMGDTAGIVEHVGVRSTRIRKLDQSLVAIPNNTLSNAAVTNWSRLQKRRIDFYVGVTYSTNSQQMRELVAKIREMLMSRELVDPESVVVHFVNFGGSSLDIRIICYVWIADWNGYTAEQEQINLEVMDIVESMNLSFAFPSTSVYIESVPKPRKPSNQRPKQYVPASQEAADALAETQPRASDVPDQANVSASNDNDAGDDR